MREQREMQEFISLTGPGKARYEELRKDGKMSHDAAYRICSRAHGLKSKDQPAQEIARDKGLDDQLRKFDSLTGVFFYGKSVSDISADLERAGWIFRP